MAAAASLPAWQAAERKLRLAPTLPDLFFGLLIVALFGRPYCWQALLGDGDTGWHIRTGEYILAHGVPARDLFSFSRAGQPWYAWEWLSDAIFAQLHAGGVLKGWRCWARCWSACRRRCCSPGSCGGAWARGSRWPPPWRRPAPPACTTWRGRTCSLLPAGGGAVAARRRPALAHAVALDAGPDGGVVGQSARRVRRLAGNAGSADDGERGPSATARHSGATGCWRRFPSLATLVNPYGWQLHRHVLGFLGSGGSPSTWRSFNRRASVRRTC